MGSCADGRRSKQREASCPKAAVHYANVNAACNNIWKEYKPEKKKEKSQTDTGCSNEIMILYIWCSWTKGNSSYFLSCVMCQSCLHVFNTGLLNLAGATLMLMLPNASSETAAASSTIRKSHSITKGISSLARLFYVETWNHKAVFNYL